MITIVIPAQPEQELWDSVNEEFVYIEATKEAKITLEHSLVSISKWESKWKKAFLKDDQKTAEEMLDYIRCMTIEKNIPEQIYNYIPAEEMMRIKDYIDDRMSATVINSNSVEEPKGRRGKDVITSELIYYWMIANEIPFECEKWHLNRLLALIQVCSAKNAPSKKMSKRDLLKRNASLNAARRAKSGSKG